MVKLLEKYKMVIMFITLAVVATVFSIYKETNSSVSYEGTGIMVEQPEPEIETFAIIEEVSVYICGEINEPGVYSVTQGSLIQDVIDIAGGVTPDADLLAINLAGQVSPYAQIIVPKTGESAIYIDNLTSSSKININTATTAELCTLSGIGDAKAQAIIDHRNNIGFFSSTEQLKDVSGIGDKTFESLQNYITIQ
ncbi:MAG: hypothetical protein ATN35_07750 [Epulopiscium sp. Nele67-Bin004]|nr:MAG: hypothetical protein ATN35_07750 [Epulopiscium sp. Nele67-Bin004]